MYSMYLVFFQISLQDPWHVRYQDVR